MKRSILVSVVMTAAIAMPVGYLAGQTKDDDDRANPGTITVQSEGRATGVPDVLNVSFGIETREPSAADALRRSSEQANAVIALLKDQGIEARDIQTTNLSTYPEMAPDGRKITGYVATNTVRVRIRKLDQTGPIIDAVSQIAGDTLRVHSLNFSMDDEGELMDKARTRAVSAARGEAGQLAKAAGLKLRQVRSMTSTSSSSLGSADQNLGGQGVAARLSAEIAPEPGSREFFVSVKVVYEVTR